MRIWLPSVRVGTGTDVFVDRLAEGLARAGHDPVVQWFPARSELMPWTLARVAPPAGAEVIHANSWQAFAFRRPGLPLVVTEHHYVHHPLFAPLRGPAQSLYHELFIRACLALSYRRADVLVAVSDTTASAMRADRPGLKVRVIHNWVDTGHFCPAAAPRIAQAPFRLLFVGNPSRRKGADLLPALASALGPGFRLLCLGGLREDIRDRGPNNVDLLPRTAPDAMPDLYRSVDAVVVPARYEAFGFVALEAMACGIPVIGFDSSGVAEVCGKDAGALLAPVEDLNALAAAARALAADPALASRLGQAGRRRALERFSEGAGIAAYVETYREAMHRTRR